MSVVLEDINLVFMSLRFFDSSSVIKKKIYCNIRSMNYTSINTEPLTTESKDELLYRVDCQEMGREWVLNNQIML